MQRLFAKRLLATTALAVTILEGAAAVAAELPTFEVSSFPATRLQLSVIGSAGVREQAPTPTLTRDDMPASPHQLAVLTPRRSVVTATNPTTVGASRN
jgi:hypothetical protein